MTQGKTHREPLLRIAKRDGIARPKAWAIRIIAVLLSLVVSGIFIFAVTKLNPFQVYEGIFDGAFGTPRRSWVTVRDAMMLLCIGVGLAPAFKMRFWNIGAEGQILIGGIVTAGFMRAFGGDISTPLLLVIMAVVSLLAGAAWGMVPATFKAVWNTNETLFTLMMNYVAIQLTSYFVALWENPVGSNTVGVINQRTKDGWFPELFGQEYGLNVVLVLLLTVGMNTILVKILPVINSSLSCLIQRKSIKLRERLCQRRSDKPLQFFQIRFFYPHFGKCVLHSFGNAFSGIPQSSIQIKKYVLVFHNLLLLLCFLLKAL